jgi:hypothetical protein
LHPNNQFKRKRKKRQKHFDKLQLENARNHEKMQEHYKFRDAEMLLVRGGGAENNYTFAAEIIIWNANTIIQR